LLLVQSIAAAAATQFGPAPSRSRHWLDVIAGVAILGRPGLPPLQSAIRALRSRGKVVC
jgi:hypothetical protein